jgi:hypothetical protein
MVGRLVVFLLWAAAVVQVDPAVLAVMAETGLVPLVPALEVAEARVDRHPPLAQREHLPLAALAVRGELQALGVLELHRLYPPLPVLVAAVAAERLVLLRPTTVAALGLQFR